MGKLINMQEYITPLQAEEKIDTEEAKKECHNLINMIKFLDSKSRKFQSFSYSAYAAEISYSIQKTTDFLKKELKDISIKYNHTEILEKMSKIV